MIDFFGVTAPQLETFVLILVRVFAMLATFPIFSAPQIPHHLRFGFGLLIGFILFKVVPAIAPLPTFYDLIAALVAGSFTIAAGLSFVFSWLHAGGNPHGMGTPPGLWQLLRWVFWSALLGTVGLTILAKGRGRLLIVAAMASAVLADFTVIWFDFD